MVAASSLGNVHIIGTLERFRGLSAAGLPPVVFLRGTSTPLDGGQGFYSVNLTDKTSADNGSSIIVDGGGFRWYLVSEATAAQIIAALSNNGTTPALDPILGGVSTIAAATTTDLSTVAQAAVTVTGSGVSISSLGTLGAGRIRVLTFADVNTLVHNATSLLLPGAANISTKTNDVAGFISLGSGNWQCIWYTEASGGTPGTLSISEGGTGKTTAIAAYDALSAQGADIASATTTDLSAATGEYVNITGSVTITGLGTAPAGTQREVKFTGAPLLTYNATSLILPSAANIQAAANDTAKFVSLGSGNWICTSYQKATGYPVTSSKGQLPGTATNDSASAGNVGEYVVSTIAFGSPVALTTATAANITSISLTAGDWDVWIDCRITGNAATTLSSVITSISTTSATLDGTTAGRAAYGDFYTQAVFATLPAVSNNCGPARVLLSATTTIYFVVTANFAVNTCSGYGSIFARRRR